jgi:hypothetical protein
MCLTGLSLPSETSFPAVLTVLRRYQWSPFEGSRERVLSKGIEAPLWRPEARAAQARVIWSPAGAKAWTNEQPFDAPCRDAPPCIGPLETLHAEEPRGGESRAEGSTLNNLHLTRRKFHESSLA